MKVLVLGGTGFIGRRLVDSLLKENCDVTIATSGKSGNPFGEAVSLITFDRFDISSMADKLASPPYFDVVFDQIGFGPDDMKNSIDIFRGRTGIYVYTSSGSVYSGNGVLREVDFDPRRHEIRHGGIGDLGYSEGKRSAEAYLFQKAPFPVAAARFPIVIGHDDSTLRFQNHVMRVNSGDAFSIPANCARRNYVWVDDAGRFLAWLGLSGKTGAYNAATPFPLSAADLVKQIGTVLGRNVSIDSASSGKGDSTYFNESDSILSVDKAESEGFTFTNFEEWFPLEVRKTLEKGGESPNSAEYFRKLLSRQVE